MPIGIKKPETPAVFGFTIVQPDNGSSPTADTNNDTITFTSSNNSVTITGDSTTDTVDFVVGGVVTLTDGATPALDASLGNTFVLSSVQNPTIAIPTNPVNGQKITIIFRAVSADRTLSLTTGSSGAFAFGTEITALTATTSGKIDFIGCIYSNLNSRWNVVAYVKGY